MKLSGQPDDPDYVAAMSKPGFKVMHIQDLDFRSSCITFIECLTIIRTWSAAHPDHVPILITMNTNDGKSPAHGGVQELPFDETAYDALDKEIASVFSADELITPDQIQGHYATLRDAVLKHGWPTLGSSRGKFLFALDEKGRHIAAYIGQRKSLGPDPVRQHRREPAAERLPDPERTFRHRSHRRRREAGLYRPHPRRRRHGGSAQQRHHPP